MASEPLVLGRPARRLPGGVCQLPARLAESALGTPSKKYHRALLSVKFWQAAQEESVPATSRISFPILKICVSATLLPRLLPGELPPLGCGPVTEEFAAGAWLASSCWVLLRAPSIGCAWTRALLWLEESRSTAEERAASLWLPDYKAVLQIAVPGFENEEFSDLAYSPATGTLFTVSGKQPLLIELSLAGKVLRSIPVIGAADLEGVAVLEGAAWRSPPNASTGCRSSASTPLPGK